MLPLTVTVNHSIPSSRNCSPLTLIEFATSTPGMEARTLYLTLISSINQSSLTLTFGNDYNPDFNPGTFTTLNLEM